MSFGMGYEKLEVGALLPNVSEHEDGLLRTDPQRFATHR